MTLDPREGGWRRMKLKYVADLRSGEAITSDAIAPDGPYPVFGGNGLRGYTNSYTHEGTRVLIGRQGALCGNINYASGRFWASEHAVVATIRGEHHVRWLGELLRSMNLNQYSQAAAQPGLAVEFVSNLEVLVPPIHLQRAIADYLDAETARIDALIAAKEKLLAILAEKRRAVITQAVTRGLNPDVPMRHSGVPWIGEIPAHWEVIRLKFLLQGIEQGWSPQCDSHPAAPDGWGVLKSGCCNGGVFREEENKALPVGVDPAVYLEVAAGDVLMSRASGSQDLIGACARVPMKVRPKLMFSDLMYRLRVQSTRLHADHLVLVVASDVGRTQIRNSITSTGGLANKLPQSAVANFQILTPPLEEQVEICMFVSRAVDSVDRMVSATERTINLLRERREALITAAVTGQLELGS